MRSFGFTLLRSETYESLRNEQASLQETIASMQRMPRPSLEFPDEYPTSPEFNAAGLAGAAMEKLIKEFDFETIVDIGAGAQLHSKLLSKHGKKVTAVDLGTSEYHRQKDPEVDGQITEILGDINEIDFPTRYDCVWASHVLEHQSNVSLFLGKIASILKEGGVLAITVPPLKHEIVGGHVSVWNAGLLLYRLVLAGLDCRDASVLAYGYNISVIVRKHTIRDMQSLGLEFDCGDIRKIRPFLPDGLHFNSNALDDPFDGNIERLNW